MSYTLRTVLLLYGIAFFYASDVGCSFTPLAVGPAFGASRLARLHTQRVAPLCLGSPGLAKPKVELGQKTAVGTKVGQKSATVQKQRVQVDEPKTRREQDFEDAPMYKVMLIGDDEYDPAHTIQRLCEVIEDVDEGLASTIFKSAQTAGKAMCGKYPMEHAELYVEQLLRSEPIIFSELEEENVIS